MARLDSIAADIREGKFSFEDAATFLSEDKDTRQNGGYLINSNDGSVRFQIQDLPAEIGKVVYNMQVGEISRPFVFKNEKGKEVVAIVKLKARIKSHMANPTDDFQLLKDYITGHKSQELIEAWIRKSQQDTYIYIDPEYRDCDFHYPGWIHNNE